MNAQIIVFSMVQDGANWSSRDELKCKVTANIPVYDSPDYASGSCYVNSKEIATCSVTAEGNETPLLTLRLSGQIHTGIARDSSPAQKYFSASLIASENGKSRIQSILGSTKNPSEKEMSLAYSDSEDMNQPSSRRMVVTVEFEDQDAP